MRKLRWLVPLVVGTIFMVACGSLQATPPELSEEIGPAEVNGCIDCEPFMEVDLLAGQDMKVGSVTVTNDDEQVCVTYELDQDALDAGWLLYETHLYLGATNDFPGTKINERLGPPFNSNPIPGQFPHGDAELDGEPTWGFCIPLEDLGVETCDDVFVAAHAVVKRVVGREATSAILYGNIGGYEPDVVGQGDLWAIDPIARTETLLFDNPSTAYAANWYPNALAYDEAQRRLYFTTYPNSLVYYDLDADLVVPAGTLPSSGDVFGAAFGDGYYWYLLNQTNVLYRVSLHADGTIAGTQTFTMPTAHKLSQGDIVYRDGVIYGTSGTGAGGGDNLKGFFTYDTATHGFTVVREDANYGAPQLAWGLDDAGNEVLYGTRQRDVGLTGVYNAGPFVFMTIDPETGFEGLPIERADGGSFNRYQDLASHVTYEDVWQEETAWGDGYRFNERGNWALWFTYRVCCVPNSIVYGVTGNGSSGGLWAIEFLDDGTIDEDLLLSLTSLGGATVYYPNGLAYDRVNHRLYYAVNTTLYMYDFTNTPVVAATGLLREVYGATWGDGKYWYVGNNADDMYVVAGFDASTGIGGTFGTFETGFAGKSFAWGDLALDASEGVIYASTSTFADDAFFSYDLNEIEGSRYTSIATSGGAVGLQIGFGEDGVLYGHNTGLKAWFAVDKAGTVESLGTGLNAYNDLASGPWDCD